jgi:hypothetical protein
MKFLLDFWHFIPIDSALLAGIQISSSIFDFVPRLAFSMNSLPPANAGGY